MPYKVLAFYIFTPLEDPSFERARQLNFLEEKDVKCRIYISEQGINGQMSATLEDAEAYIKWMHQDERFKEIDFKCQEYPEHVFPRLTIKVRKQLVALDEEVDLALRGEHVSSSEWDLLLQEKDDNTLLLDVRNDYEWELGHFEGAELPKLKSFRDFREFADDLKETRDPETTRVMMYCTGGIRCELYSALLKKQGFQKIYQLEGGVLKYGQEKGNRHWKGKLFVFDDRLSVPLSPDTKPISHCMYCKTLSDFYFNCANMDCNHFFIACTKCAEKALGCCSKECEGAERVRPFEKREIPKPFRRAHFLSDKNET